MKFMDKNLVAISSLAMDLKRVALAYYNGSDKTARRFLEESLKRSNEIDTEKTKSYLKGFISNVSELVNQKDKSKLSEDALMYSTIFQNYVTHNLSSK